MTDKDHLKQVQYRDSKNIEARINLHRLFGTGKVSFYEVEKGAGTFPDVTSDAP